MGASSARAGLLAGDRGRWVGEWQAAGVFAALHREPLRRLNAAELIDWSTAVVRSMAAPFALFKGP